MLERERVMELMHYNPVSGVITRMQDVKASRVGDIAGHIVTGAKTQYIKISIDGEDYFAHHLAYLIMTGEWPDDDMDHEDGNGLNNKWGNLRVVPHGENMKNKTLYKTNTSGYPGVSFCNARKKWIARIGSGGKKEHLGAFDNRSAAIVARWEAEARHGYHQNHGRGSNEDIEQHRKAAAAFAKEAAGRPMPPPSNNTSGYRGVSWHKPAANWHARITVKGKTHSLGYFDEIEAAVAARREAEARLK